MPAANAVAGVFESSVGVVSGLEQQVPNHCPFGCATEDLNENGYCYHLLGFTADRRYYEPVEKVYRRAKDPETGAIKQTWEGRYRVNGKKRQRVDKEVHTLINPQQVQVVEGITRMANLWHCWRVYDASAPEQRVDRIGPTSQEEAESRLRDQIEELEERLRQLKTPLVPTAPPVKTEKALSTTA